MTWREFQDRATNAMKHRFGVALEERAIPNFPKKFDMVSADLHVVGDAKYLTLVKGERTPPAKLMEISGHVWLLERLAANHPFLVFGNQREVPQLWLKKYHELSPRVEFYFLNDDGSLELLQTGVGSNENESGRVEGGNIHVCSDGES